jgi:hypothetical protein
LAVPHDPVHLVEADGSFEIAGIAVGKWSMQFHAPGGQEPFRSQFEIKGLPVEKTVDVTMRMR